MEEQGKDSQNHILRHNGICKHYSVVEQAPSMASGPGKWLGNCFKFPDLRSSILWRDMKRGTMVCNKWLVNFISLPPVAPSPIHCPHELTLLMEKALLGYMEHTVYAHN